MSGRDPSSSPASQLWGVPNVCGRAQCCWLLHTVTWEDTMSSLALKYDTSIGRIRRANRMQWQDVLQARRYVWVPVLQQRDTVKGLGKLLLNTAVALAQSSSTQSRHCHRETSANANEFARDRDPLLID